MREIAQFKMTFRIGGRDMLGRLLKNEVKERLNEQKAKRNLERKLGRKIRTDELYSLGSWLDAAGPSQPGEPHVAPPNHQPASDSFQTMSHVGKREPVGMGKIIFVGVLIVALLGAGIFAYDYFDPFTPRPPEGVFHNQVGRFTMSYEPHYVEASNIGEGKYFYAYYSASDVSSITYVLYDFPSEPAARQGFESEKKRVEGYIKDGTRIVQQDDARFATVWLKDGQASAYWVDGSRIIRISGPNQKAVYEFESLLSNSTARDVVEVELQTNKIANGPDGELIEVGSLLKEYQTDEAAADKKYEGKTIIVVGEVATAGKDKRGNPIIGFMKPGSKSPTDGMVVCSFSKTWDSLVTRIKKGQTARVKGTIALGVAGSVVLTNCSLT
jgi:hypothetical protein